jgi:hypothetical protein
MNGFPGVQSIAEHHTAAPEPKPARIPIIPTTHRPVVTWRVTQAMTSAVLRRGWEVEPRFGQPAAWLDEIAEFTNEDAAACAIYHVRKHTTFDQLVVLVAREYVHVGLNVIELGRLLKRVEMTAVDAEMTHWRLEDPLLRQLAHRPPKKGAHS